MLERECSVKWRLDAAHRQLVRAGTPCRVHCIQICRVFYFKFKHMLIPPLQDTLGPALRHTYSGTQALSLKSNLVFPLCHPSLQGTLGAAHWQQELEVVDALSACVMSSAGGQGGAADLVGA